VLASAYVRDGERVFLKLPKTLAPVSRVVSPLLKNKPELVEKARAIYDALRAGGQKVMWDDSGNIGKRYAKADEIGVPECIVVDFTTLEDDTVTVRDRDTTEQTRVKISELAE
jgi:glycyl-tRNA synthetase